MKENGEKRLEKNMTLERIENECGNVQLLISQYVLDTQNTSACALF